ncbi:hypothetical protein JOC36_001486 [Weissella uvarum]|uniref:hypothetical protein n=1 Tax=Weissella uvarum TaxID=1479233 RepID=UPI00196209B3|nr:hypothetical protein [Weissella uvarum]MBM7617893.1 hypothetical protein [Weissella uvarum]MCM0596109.1 hypothetical protein [Weissella uvarum]
MKLYELIDELKKAVVSEPDADFVNLFVNKKNNLEMGSTRYLGPSEINGTVYEIFFQWYRMDHTVPTLANEESFFEKSADILDALQKNVLKDPSAGQREVLLGVAKKSLEDHDNNEPLRDSDVIKYVPVLGISRTVNDDPINGMRYMHDFQI